MSVRYFFGMIAILSVFSFSTPALPWGPPGHRLVGRLAESSDLLTPNAAAKVHRYFRLETAAPWLDCVRSVKKTNQGFAYQHDPKYSAPCIEFEGQLEKARMEDYVRRNWDLCPHGSQDGCQSSYHFADVPVQRDRYDRAFAGTGDHDIVSVMRAAILVLRGNPPPSGISIRDEKEALFLLAHLVGDLHQPLHVGAVYLQADGKIVDPDPANVNALEETTTHGGNWIYDNDKKLHSDWDGVPMRYLNTGYPHVLELARQVPPSDSTLPIEDWPALWASDTVLASHKTFNGLSFVPTGEKHRWYAQFVNRSEYLKEMEKLQEQQAAKASARFAQLLNAIYQ